MGEQTRRTTMAEAAEFIEQRKKEFMQAAEAGPDILSREETPKKDRNRRRRRSSVGETYGAKGKAGFCHRADGQSNMHVRNSNVKSKIVSVATHENPDKSKIRRSSTETSPGSPKSTTTRSRQNSAKCREQPPVVAFPNQQGTDFASRSEFTVVDFAADSRAASRAASRANKETGEKPSIADWGDVHGPLLARGTSSLENYADLNSAYGQFKRAASPEDSIRARQRVLEARENLKTAEAKDHQELAVLQKTRSHQELPIAENPAERELTQAPVEENPIPEKTKAQRASATGPFRKSMFTFPALPSFPLEGHGRGLTLIPETPQFLENRPLWPREIASAPGTHPAPRRRETGHGIYPRQGFCVSMKPVPTTVSTAPFSDHAARSWLDGRNHPDDKGAALNSNSKLRAKWDRQLHQRNHKIAQAKSDREHKELTARLAEQRDTARKEQAYVEHSCAQRRHNNELRRMRRHAREEHKAKCQQIEDRAEQIAQHKADMVMDQIGAEDEAIKQRGKSRQEAISRQWDVQNASLKRNTAAYRKLYQVQSPHITTSFRSLYHWCPNEEHSEPKKRVSGKVAILERQQMSSTDLFGPTNLSSRPLIHRAHV